MPLCGDNLMEKSDQRAGPHLEARRWAHFSAGDWPTMNSESALTFDLFAEDDGSDYSLRRHRSWCKTAQPSRDHIMPRLRGDPLSKVTVPPAIPSNPVAMITRVRNYFSLFYFRTFKLKLTLRKTPFLLEAFGECQERGIRPYCCSDS